MALARRAVRRRGGSAQNRAHGDRAQGPRAGASPSGAAYAHFRRAPRSLTVKTFVACVSPALVSSVAIAALAGCGGSSAAVGVAPPVQEGGQLATALARRATIRHSMLHRVSWASRAAKSRDLLYISDLENQDVAFYSWPDLTPM